MNILLINHYAGSPELGMEFRPYYMAREWVNMGHNITIVGATYSHLRKKQPEQGIQKIDGIAYYWLKTNSYKGNGAGRAISMFLFVFKLLLKASFFIKFCRPQVVIASSTYPLDNFAAKYIARRCRAKYIYEVHDLWPLSPVELGGMSRNHPFIRIMQLAENFAYKNCDAVVSILPNALEHMVEHGLAREKFYCIPNGIVKSDWDQHQPLPIEHEKLLRMLKEQKFIVGYTGAHGTANSLQSVIDAVAMLLKENIVLVLVGDGQEKENLISYVRKNEIENVYFLPSIAKYQIPTLLGMMDVLFIGWQRQAIYRFGISPNKLFDYMMAGKPVIQAIDAGNNLIEDSGCGFNVEPDNPEAIAKAIMQMKMMTGEELAYLGRKGNTYVLENHSLDLLSNKFIQIINSL
jgi:glycosyltransferase involved in cell wall biosynthesis